MPVETVVDLSSLGGDHEQAAFEHPAIPHLAAALATALTLLAGGASAQDTATTPGVTELDKVMVKGVRGAQAEAIENKRSAAQIIDSISAEDIGKLPDVTITDSLQRVPGVQIRRSAGEGSQLNIRGMPQVQTTMNGELYLSAGGGDQYGQPNIGRAQPDFVDIPPTLAWTSSNRPPPPIWMAASAAPSR